MSTRLPAEYSIFGRRPPPDPAFVKQLAQTATADEEGWTEADAGAGNDDDDDDDGDQELVEPTTYMFERATAVASIGEIFVRVGRQFLPYVQDGVAAIAQALKDVHGDVRTQAIVSMSGAVRAHRPCAGTVARCAHDLGLAAVLASCATLAQPS